MRRRAPLQNLRGSDPMLLEVQLQDLLLRPSSQLEPPNLCDLFALDEVDGTSRSLKKALEGFVKRARGEMAEIADGSEMATFVREIGEVEPSRVPASFRAFLGELAAREGRDVAGLKALLSDLEASEPEAFAFGAPRIKAQRVEAVEPKERTKGRSRRGAAGGTTRSSSGRSSKPAPKKIAKPVVDIDKHNHLRDIIIERLAGVSENGLAEHVLIAGVRHRARPEYPKVGPHEVMAVLNELLSRGLARKSAGRWMSR